MNKIFREHINPLRSVNSFRLCVILAIVLALLGCDSKVLQNSSNVSLKTPGEVVLGYDGLPFPIRPIKSVSDFRSYLIVTAPKTPIIQKYLEDIFNDRVISLDQQKKILEEACFNGDTDAMVLLADLYEKEGRIQKAKTLYKRAHDLGNIMATYSLGAYYLKGKGEAIDLDKAHTYMIEAAKKGYMLAGVGYAEVLLNQGQEKKAFEILKRYADYNVPVALMTLADMYLKGVGVPKNETKYRESLDNAWKYGSLEAGYRIARHNLYDEYGYDGGKVDYYLFAKEAANRGSLDAKLLLCLEETKKIRNTSSRNFQEIIAICEDAAKQGEPRAMYALSLIYYLDESGLKNLEKVHLWLARAEASGDPYIILSLASAYEQGQFGFERDMNKSYEYAKKAAELGYPLAMVYFAALSMDTRVNDIPKLQEPDYYSCILWFNVASKLVSDTNISNEDTLGSARFCEKALKNSVSDFEQVEKRLNLESDHLVKKYQNSIGLHAYGSDFQGGF